MKDSNFEKLKLIFIDILNLDENADLEKLSKLSQPNWDSLAQVSLISAVANEFSLKIEANEFELFSSFKSIKMLLEDKGIWYLIKKFDLLFLFLKKIIFLHKLSCDQNPLRIKDEHTSIPEYGKWLLRIAFYQVFAEMARIYTPYRKQFFNDNLDN